MSHSRKAAATKYLQCKMYNQFSSNATSKHLTFKKAIKNFEKATLNQIKSPSSPAFFSQRAKA